MVKKSVLSVLKRIRIPLLVTGLILSVVCSPIIFHVASDTQQEALQNRQSVIDAVKGELIPFDMNMSEDFVVDLGNCNTTQTAEYLAQGYELNPICVGSSSLIQIGFSDNKMSISANITNSDNELVGYIENNTWKSVSPNSLQIGDRNYNNYAFEIVGPNMVPIFNVRVVGPNEIQIGGLFDSGTVLISDNGGGILGNPSPQNISELLTPLFKYPSDKHTGELVNPTYASGLPTDNSDKMLFESSLLSIIGYVLAFTGGLFIAIFGADTIIDFTKKKSGERNKS